MRKETSDSQPAAPSHGAAQWGTRFARAFLWLIGTFVLLLAVLVSTLYFAVRTETGTRLLWDNLSRLIPGQISGELIDGTLGNGLTLRNVRYVNGETVFRIDRLRARWILTNDPLALTVQYLRIGTVEARLAPSPDDDKPPVLPQRLTLPLALDLREVLVNKVVIRREDKETVYSNIRLQARSDSVNHVLQSLEADTPVGHASAHLKLNGNAPFESTGTASLSGTLKDQQYKLRTDLSGTLSALSLKVNAASGDFNGKADIQATPFDRVPVRRAEIHVDAFNPNTFNPAWPKARLTMDTLLAPVSEHAEKDMKSPLAVAGPVTLVNAQPGPWNEGLLPLASAKAEILLTKSVRRLSQLTIRLDGNATLSGAGEFDEKGRGQLALTADALDLHALHSALKPTELDGPISVKLADTSQTLDLKLSDSDIGVEAQAQFVPEQITLRQATLSSGEAQLQVSGQMARGEKSDFALKGTLRQFDPSRFLAQQAAPEKRGSKGKTKSRNKSGNNRDSKRTPPKTRSPFQANINMELQAQGSLKPELNAGLDFDIKDSSYAGQPMTGSGQLQVSGKRMLSGDAQLRIAGNRASLKGSFGEPPNQLAFDIDAPALARLGFGLSGAVKATGVLRGTVDQPHLTASYNARNLKAGDLAVASLTGNAAFGGLPESAPDAETRLKLDARDLRSSGVRMNALNIDMNGTYSNHSLRIAAAGTLGALRADLSAAAQGRLQRTEQGLAWAGTVSRLENRSTPQMSLGAPVAVDYAPGRVEIGSARVTLARALIRLQHLRYDGESLSTAGSVSQLDTAHLLSIYREFSDAPLPLDSTLVLNGEWDLVLGKTPGGSARIERTRGDLSVKRDAREIPLGINQLALRANLDGKQISLEAAAQATRIGRFDGQGSIALEPEARLSLPDQGSALSARIRAQIPKLQNLTALAGPTVNIDGVATADMTISGSMGDPVLSGTVNGDRLGLTLYDQGVRLRDGIARLRIDNDIVDIQQFELRGGKGFLRATGRIPLDRSSPDLKANIVADKLQILSGPAGRLTLSGQATASNVDQQLFIGGKFTVDRALFTLPEKRAPELSDDVVIIRDSKSGKQDEAPGTDQEKPAGPFSPRVSIVVDLGDRFLFEGAGADLRLAGTIRIESAPGETLQAYGTVRVVEGMYEAFGAELEIERGILNFQGPLNNPNINILAMRREQEVAAGVQITGTIKQPRVELVSEPAVSEDEKLSWLVFGRPGGGTDTGQAQSAAKGAALGLLNKLGGNRIGEKLGLDEFSIGKSEFGLDGAQVVNLGKELTDRLFIGFEQSLASAASVVKLTYELSRHWSVVLRGGDVTGIDMAFNKRFDHILRPQRKQASPNEASGK